MPESKIRVIPYGVGPPFTADGPAADGDYVLAVSTLEPRKNLARLVEGFRRSGLDGLELRVVGAEGWGGVSVDGDRVRTAGRRRRRGARAALPRRGGGRLRLALRGVRAARARGDGLRATRSSRLRAGRSASSQTASRSRSIRATPTRSPTACAGQSPRARRPSARGGRPTTAGSAPCRLTSTSTASSPGEAARRHRRGRPRAPPHRRRDVRRGAPARARAARGRGAARRGHAPPGPRSGRHRADRAPGPEPVGAHGVRAAARCCGGSGRRSRTSSTSSRRAYRGPLGRHGPRPLVRADALADGPARPHALPDVRPGLGSPRRPCAGRLRAHEATTSSSTTGSPSEKIVVTPIRRRSRLPPERHALRTGRRTLLFVGGIQPRKDPLTAIEALALVDGDLDLVARRRREARRRRGAQRRCSGSGSSGASTSRARRARGARGALPRRRLPRLPVALRGLRPAGARGDGLRDAGRRGRRGRRARGGRRRRDPRRARRPGGARRRNPRALADRERLVAAGLERAGRFSWAETARRTLAVYRELL